MTIQALAIATAVAFLALGGTHAKALDCDRFPSLCDQSETRAATEASSRNVPDKKRKGAARSSPSAAAPEPRHVGSQERVATQPREQLPMPRAKAASKPDKPPRHAAMATVATTSGKRTESPALVAAGAFMTLPSDDPRTGAGVELASVGQVEPPSLPETVHFVNSNDVNEIDLTTTPESADLPWLRYLLATMGAALAAASAMRFLIV